MAELLRIEGLRAGYGEAVVLNGIDCALPEGQTLALLGRNGMGKTTSVATIMGLLPATSGTIRHAGASVAGLPPHAIAQRGIGLVPEGRQIFPRLSVEENLVATARGATPRWTLPRIWALFPHLEERRRSPGTQLSGGEQQMLAIGRALMTNPRLLLLDEPLEGLAPIICEELLKAIVRITREEGLSAIIVEQHPQAVLKISDRSVVLDHGKVVYSGEAKTLLDDPAMLEQLIGVARH